MESLGGRLGTVLLISSFCRKAIVCNAPIQQEMLNQLIVDLLINALFVLAERKVLLT